jgi:hypothetical protein
MVRYVIVVMSLVMSLVSIIFNFPRINESRLSRLRISVEDKWTVWVT